MTYDVVVIGSATRDVFITSKSFRILADPTTDTGKVQALPLASKSTIDELVFATGGGGTNAAVTFARQGMKTLCIGTVGQDIAGTEVIEELTREGVDTAGIRRHADDLTAYSVVFVDTATGERTILSYKGEGQHIEPDRVDWATLEASWLYLDSLGGNVELMRTAIEWATHRGVKIAMNPGTRELALGLEALRPFLEKATIVMTNREEAAGLLGIPAKPEEAVFKGMADIVGGVWVMTKGREGTLVRDGQHQYRAGVPDSPVVERTGAGDAFNSAFVVEYARSGDVAKAIQYGTANASAVVTKFGAKAGILKQGDSGAWPLVDVTEEAF